MQRQPNARGAAGSGSRLGTAHRPLRQEVLDEIRSRIIAGHYAQGTRMLEEELAAELGVSRNPVREALQGLAGEGFVEIEPRRGARVTMLTARRTDDLFEVRQSLEGLVASLAARRRTEAQLSELTSIVERGVDASASGDLELLPGLNTAFHRCLSAAADNQLLTDTLERLAHVIEWVYTSRIAQRSLRSWSEHEAILRAIAERDPDAAEREARHHIGKAREAFFADAEAS